MYMIPPSVWDLVKRNVNENQQRYLENLQSGNLPNIPKPPMSIPEAYLRDITPIPRQCGDTPRQDESFNIPSNLSTFRPLITSTPIPVITPTPEVIPINPNPNIISPSGLNEGDITALPPPIPFENVDVRTPPPNIPTPITHPPTPNYPVVRYTPTRLPKTYTRNYYKSTSAKSSRNKIEGKNKYNIETFNRNTHEKTF